MHEVNLQRLWSRSSFAFWQRIQQNETNQWRSVSLDPIKSVALSMDNQPEKELNILWNLNIQQNQEKNPYQVKVHQTTKKGTTREASIRVRAPNTHIPPADPKIKLFKSKIGALWHLSFLYRTKENGSQIKKRGSTQTILRTQSQNSVLNSIKINGKDEET